MTQLNEKQTDINLLIEWRRKGICYYLLRKLLDVYPKEAKMALEVRESNLGAIKLYKKVGFLEVRKVENYYGDGSNATKMVRAG